MVEAVYRGACSFRADKIVPRSASMRMYEAGGCDGGGPAAATGVARATRTVNARSIETRSIRRDRAWRVVDMLPEG
jgi:hypothetical protein